MPVELPVAPIPSEDPKKKKEKAADDENKLGDATNKPGGKPTDEEELASLVKLYPFSELYLQYRSWMHNI
jgi:hypothetical protein